MALSPDLPHVLPWPPIASSHWFVQDLTAKDERWHDAKFGFNATHIVLENKSSNPIRYTFAQPGQHEEVLAPGDVHTIEWKAAAKIHYKLTVKGDELHVRAW